MDRAYAYILEEGKQEKAAPEQRLAEIGRISKSFNLNLFLSSIYKGGIMLVPISQNCKKEVRYFIESI